ncbi:hypothetical protein PENSPDRAFT_679456 [Peniophora sp. CONT]|nr:hypothetical protein PENSPDRAFT_679456 [Peniophora sp. CONT]
MDGSDDQKRKAAIQSATAIALQAWKGAPTRKEVAFTTSLASTLSESSVPSLFKYVTMISAEEEHISGGDLTLGWAIKMSNPNGEGFVDGVQHCVLQVKTLFDNYDVYLDPYLKYDVVAKAAASTEAMKTRWGFKDKDSKGFFNVTFKSMKTKVYQLSQMITIVQTKTYITKHNRIAAGYFLVNAKGCSVISVFDMVGAMSRCGVRLSTSDWLTLNSMMLYAQPMENILYWADDQDALKTFVIDINLNDGAGGDFQPTEKPTNP